MVTWVIWPGWKSRPAWTSAGQEWYRINDWVTSFLANTTFHRRIKDGVPNLTEQPFADLLLECLEVVGKLGPPDQSQQMQLYRYWVGSSSSIILRQWKSERLHTGRKRWWYFWPSNFPSFAERLPSKQGVCSLWWGGLLLNYPCSRLPPL